MNRIFSLALLMALAATAMGQTNTGGNTPYYPNKAGSGGPPTGAASNCLTGTYPGPGLSSTCVVAGVAGQAIAPASLPQAAVQAAAQGGTFCPANQGNTFYVCGMPSSCTYASVNYTGALDCGWAAALAYTVAQSGQNGGKVVVPTGFWQKNAIWTQPTTTNGKCVSIEGQLLDNSIIIQNTSTPSSAMLVAPSQPGNFCAFDVKNVSFDANNNANSCGDLGSLIRGHWTDVNCSGVIPGSDHDWSVGINGQQAQELKFDQVYASEMSYATSLAQISVALSGGAPTATINNPGAGYPSASNVRFALLGTQNGTSDHPCSSMGTTTGTIVGGQVATFTSTATGCAGPVYAQAYPLSTITAGFRIFGSDSTFEDLYAQGFPIGIDAEYGANTFIHPHPTEDATCILVGGNGQTIVGAELDTCGQYGIDFQGVYPSSLFGTGGVQGFNSGLPGYSSFHFGASSGPAQIVNNLNLCAAETGGMVGYNRVLTTTGPMSIASGIVTNPPPANSIIAADPQCPADTMASVDTYAYNFTNTITAANVKVGTNTAITSTPLALGAIPYGTGNTPNVAGSVAGNTAATDQLLVSRGTGTLPASALTYTSTGQGGTTATGTWSTPVPVGALIACGTWNLINPTSNVITDSAGDTYTAYGSIHTDTTTSGFTQTFYTIATGSVTSTSYTPATGSFPTVQCNAATNVVATSPTDGQCSVDWTSGTGTCSSAITTTVNGDYLFCQIVGASSTVGVGAGFTAGSSFSSNFLNQYQVQSSAGSITPTAVISSGSNATMTCSAFKANTTSRAQAPILTSAINPTSVGATTPGTGAFTSLTSNGSAVALASVSNPITSATAGSGISAVTCTTAACTNLRGTYTMTATTVSAGATILTLVWPTTTTAYVCLVSQDGGTLAIAPSHSVATATGMAIVSDLAITSGSIGIDYSCQP